MTAVRLCRHVHPPLRTQGLAYRVSKGGQQGLGVIYGTGLLNLRQLTAESLCVRAHAFTHPVVTADELEDRNLVVFGELIFS